MDDDGRETSGRSPGDGENRREFLTQVAVTAASPLFAGVGASSALAATVPASADAAEIDVPVGLNVNGKMYDLKIDPRATLLDALRERLGLPGTKKGCDHGACGACTVLVDGRRVNACLTLALAVEGKPVTTVEGLAEGDKLHPIQAAFLEHDAFQCGYCTPGQICSAVGMLREGKPGTDAGIREAMAGNLCRCGAYANIVAAIRDVIDHPTT
jgi:xanthine dehydrogenase YagT iron-sulfur-binding subunit